jgi:hypothetical protein
MSCPKANEVVRNDRETDPGTYFNEQFEKDYKESCGKQQSGSLNDVSDCNSIFETLLKRNKDDNTKYNEHTNLSGYITKLKTLRETIDANENAQLVTKNRVRNSVQRSKDISMKYTVFLGGIIVLLIAETGVLLFI